MATELEYPRFNCKSYLTLRDSLPAYQQPEKGLPGWSCGPLPRSVHGHGGKTTRDMNRPGREGALPQPGDAGS